MKYRLTSPEVIISLRTLSADSPSVTPEGNLALDPIMTLSAVNRSDMIREWAPLLSEAAQRVATHEIRNMGTLGGNLCQQTRCLYYNQRHIFQFVEPCYKRGGEICYFIPKGKKCWAVFMADTAPPLISLGAQVKIIGQEVRQIPLEELYTGEAEKPLHMASGEILSQILIPRAPENRGAAFSKSSLRGGLEFATLSVAAVLDMEDDGETCSRARLTIGAVSAAPLRARKAESTLTGKPLSKDLFSQVADQVAAEIRPIPHHGHTRDYLTECLRVTTRDAVSSAAEGISK
jgi:CO/xanthine dehydrogenase FAD-binding subunit